MPDLHGGGNLDKYDLFFFASTNSSLLCVAVAMTLPLQPVDERVGGA